MYSRTLGNSKIEIRQRNRGRRKAEKKERGENSKYLRPRLEVLLTQRNDSRFRSRQSVVKSYLHSGMTAGSGQYGNRRCVSDHRVDDLIIE